MASLVRREAGLPVSRQDVPALRGAALCRGLSGESHFKKTRRDRCDGFRSVWGRQPRLNKRFGRKEDERGLQDSITSYPSRGWSISIFARLLRWSIHSLKR